ncbi:hydrogenase nickel incorporation protein HypB [Celerinatantimonas yamalensis]|uniref:Hydrogenase maturation factor HypB n=1 Tax=Celerinatantimonas yamalensis TaxID=559956 RepID=A0ABW9GDM2_9GAMM
MCSTCGCSEGEVTITSGHHSDDASHCHDHAHHHHAHHDHCQCQTHDSASCEHEHEHDETIEFETSPSVEVHHHYYHHGDVHHHIHYHLAALPEAMPQPTMSEVTPTVKRTVTIEEQVLAKNDRIAAHNREHFAAQHLVALNFVSSPGSGKTTLLCETLRQLLPNQSCVVIEGDQQTQNDAQRIEATGAPAIQINTGKGCHLDAQMIHDAMHQLDAPQGSYLFIENVGNLVCPAGFDLGEKHKVVVLSVTEGEDKPLKYPHMFAAASVMLINKIDLLEHLDFDLQRCMQYAHQVNPELIIIPISATTGVGMDEWLSWLETQPCA